MLTMITVLAATAVLQANPAPRLLDKGDQSHVGDARQSVARTPVEWDALWRIHAGDRPQPKVDLTREMVVGVFLGSRATAGFAVDIVAAREEAGALVVRYRETRPAPGLLVAQVITSAYAIVALPRRDGAVTFEKVE